MEAAIQSCSKEKVFWKYTANLQQNTHAEIWFYWNHISAWVFSRKFAAYFQNISASVTISCTYIKN